MLVLSRTRISLAILLGVIAMLVVASIAPASAKPKDKDEVAGKAATPAMTEDNDRNDGGTRNNVVDNGDNAHPSGKDRSVEHGGSGNQGKAKADPDDDGRGPDRSNGGVDQPNRPGGTDKADQDGNNGCGNDDDFEDDNEGRCGPATPTTPTPGDNDKPNKPSKPNKPAKPSKPGKPSNNGGGNNGGGNNGGGNNGGGNNGGGKPDKIGICHRTGSMTNPYVFINVSTNATKGHGGHDGDVIGADSASDCPGITPVDPTDPKDPPTKDKDKDKDKDKGEVGGVIVIRPPADRDNEPEVIVHTPRRRVPADRTITRPLTPAAPNRVLAATGSRVVALASIAALALLLGGGLLGIRRFAPKQ